MSNYVQGEFEVELPANVLSGTVGAELHEIGEPSTRILDINDDAEIDVNWSLTGWMQRMVCGSWEVDAYFESIGEGKEFELEGPQAMPVDPTGNGQYKTSIKLPAGTIQTAPDETDILYKVTVSVTYKDPGGRPGPIAGFVELPMVQFYKDV